MTRKPERMVVATETLSEPDWPTTMRSRLADGRCMGVDGSVWLYRRVPMAPVVDATDSDAALAATAPLAMALDDLGASLTWRIARRSFNKSSYRQLHILAVDIPRRFVPPASHPLAAHLAGAFPYTEVRRRLVLVGVRLIDRLGGDRGLRAAVDSVAEILATGGTPLSDFDADFAAMDALLSRSGMGVPSPDDFRLANAWWNHGRFPDTPMLTHEDHLHVFSSMGSVRSAASLGQADCANWPPLPDHHSLAFGSVADIELPFVDQTDPASQWAPYLLDSGAVAISIRGRVEPPKITRGELRRQRKQYIDDISERASQGKMDRAEQEEMLAALTEMEGVYAGGGPSTLIDASVLVAVSGRDEHSGYDLSEMGRDIGLTINSMTSRQEKALAETMLCSPVRSNPHLHDIPSHTLAASGLNSLSIVGDDSGALLGFTERDRQPAYISPTRAATADGLPMMLVVGATRSGKTQAGLWMADQFSRMGRPVVFVDPSPSSDHSPTVLAAGGQVASLDDLMAADGVFDPLRFSPSIEDGIDMASSMLLDINPWGRDEDRQRWETPLAKALHHGISAGATCIGEALIIAKNAGIAPGEMVDPIFDLAGAYPMFRAIVGVEPGTTALRLAEGITLVKVGDAYVNLPPPGMAAKNVNQRISLALVHAMVYGSAMALRGRQGVLLLDEFWTFLTDPTDIDRLMRVAAKQEILPIGMTQKVSDATRAGLSGFISRGIIFSIERDRNEATAACELFKLEPTPERLGRITARAAVGDSGGAPNWRSLKALRDPATDTVLRGAVGIVIDLNGRAVPVEVVLPPEFLALSSTNPEDIRRRKAKQDVEAAGESVHPAPAPEDVPEPPEVDWWARSS